MVGATIAERCRCENVISTAEFLSAPAAAQYETQSNCQFASKNLPSFMSLTLRAYHLQSEPNVISLAVFQGISSRNKTKLIRLLMVGETGEDEGVEVRVRCRYKDGASVRLPYSSKREPKI